MDITKPELQQFVLDYMDLVQRGVMATVSLLLEYGLVSPHKFISDNFLSPLALTCWNGHIDLAQSL